jgi:uncharacterized protein (TIGR02246 family)
MTLLMGLMVAAASMTPQLDCRPDAAPVREVRAVARGIIDADNARDLERVLRHYTADAILMPPGEAAVSGLAAIRPRYAALFAEFEPHIEARVDEACVGGDLAFVRGHNGGRLAPRAGGASRNLNDDYLMLLRREEGAWRISHLIWHRADQARQAP